MPDELNVHRPLKQYLGDSVYVDYDGCMLVLTTENGFGPSNIIYLEPGVLNSLVEYLKWLPDALARLRALNKAVQEESDVQTNPETTP